MNSIAKIIFQKDNERCALYFSGNFGLGFFENRNVMSALLKVKVCFWDQQLPHLVRNVSSSLIDRIQYMKRVNPFGYVFKGGSNPYTSSTF